MRTDLPSGTVTFLFADVEGSTRLLHELGENGYAEALSEHRRLIREACARHDGVEVDTQGDAFFYAFPTAQGALEAARQAQKALDPAPISVRMGLHTGTPHVGKEGYIGDDVHFAARVASTGHGGQVVLSAAAAELVELELTSLGSHRLKDIPDPVSIYQLGDRAFSALEDDRQLQPAHSCLLLPGQRGGAVRSRHAVAADPPTHGHGPRWPGQDPLRARARDPGTEERFSDYRDGVFSCFLSSLREPALVLPTVATTLSLREQPEQSGLETLSSHLEGKQMLLLLDNLEQLLDCASELSELLSACPELTLLVTSRELLRVQGERAYPLPPLADDEGVSLFCDRAQVEPSEIVHELCSRLDGLPLAIELAAARIRILTPAQLLERLAQRLDVLKAGRDADPRQQTLRATIEWSHELLTTKEQELFASLAAFSGGCTLEAAEEVCDADLDSLQSLVDKSLLRFSDGRFWMLETIREYAAERLEASGEVEVRRAHAAWVLALAAEREATFGSSDEHRRFASEQDNFRAALEWAERSDSRLQLDLIGRSWPFWWYRGHPSEGLCAGSSRLSHEATAGETAAERKCWPRGRCSRIDPVNSI